MSYEAFYHLKEAPFFNIPDERYFYKSVQAEKAMLKIFHAVKRKMGLCVVTGGIGTGKTMLSRKLLDALNSDFYESSLIVMVHSEATSEWFLRKLAIQFGVENVDLPKPALISQLYERLTEIQDEGRIPVVIIDEANMVKNKEFFEEMRGLLNFESAQGKLLNFVLFGLPELKENLHLDIPLAQRIAIAIEMKPMDERNTIAYIRYRLSVAGAQRLIFNQDALALIYRYSGGVPRIVNTIADNALLEGFFERKETVDGSVLQNTLIDLGLVVSAK